MIEAIVAAIAVGVVYCIYYIYKMEKELNNSLNMAFTQVNTRLTKLETENEAKK